MSAMSTKRPPTADLGGARDCAVVLLGASAGGLEALETVLAPLPREYPLRIAVARHAHPDSESELARRLSEVCQLPVREIEDKEPFLPGVIHVAPANYHTLIEAGHTFALATPAEPTLGRPSIDLLFQSGAEHYRAQLVGILLSGGGSDGAQGLAVIKQMGGLAVVQDPAEALVPAMPVYALRALAADYVLPSRQICGLLRALSAPRSRGGQ